MRKNSRFSRKHISTVKALVSVALAISMLILLLPHAVVRAHEHAPRPRNFIVDTDMGLDDVRAIMALLAYDPEGITSFVTVQGSTSIGKASDNLIGLLESAGVDDIPVYTGSRFEGKIPPWRKTANNLAGVKFPPPRELSADTHWLNITGRTILGKIPTLYLALGPLSNLSNLEKHDPHILSKCKVIWLPAEVKKSRKGISVRSWNLSWDIESTERVLKSGAKIIIVDVKAGREAKNILSSLTDNTIASRWIKSTASKLGNHGEHIFLYDEIVAVAAVGKAKIKLSEKGYRFDRLENGKFILKKALNGNIKVASIADYNQALSTLKNLWQTPIAAHELLHKALIPAATFIKAFHGHLGPYVVLGFRAGKIALEKIHSNGHFGIEADVYSTHKPPRSCFIDGVQLGSGCTLGKNNITVHEIEDVPYVTFRTAEGRVVSIVLKKQVPSIIDSLINEGGVEFAGRKMLIMSADSLFSVGK